MAENDSKSLDDSKPYLGESVGSSQMVSFRLFNGGYVTINMHQILYLDLACLLVVLPNRTLTVSQPTMNSLVRFLGATKL